ncbi:DUF4870 domain-containing protein [Thermogemmatispora tikiterensis]|uniref:DUF4870 domain-containing protein n=1 Tax=Thermogemmatispora tikiterensis TaxID=1825093 RepID=A0A328VPZ0_9CHLR|nr:hypothetical protein [Thermogemmatispora tikiterensis]RAQ98292.1 hypothetical protein A4R35_22320 [Thermogemmatispora tikiterensis]
MLDDERKDYATVWQTRPPFEGLYEEKGSLQQQELLMHAAVAEWLPLTSYHPGTEQASDELSPSTNADSVLGLLCCLGGWLSGLLVLLFGGRSRLVRFHALQSLFFFGLVTIIDIFMMMTPIYVSRLSLWWLPSEMDALAVCCWLLLFGTLQVVTLTGWLVGLIQATRRRFYLLPVVGRLALALVGQKQEIILK